MQLEPEHLWVGIPGEFKGSKLPKGIRVALADKSVCITLLGPPGTGKTRSLYAAMHHVRARLLRDQIGAEVEKLHVHHGEYERKEETDQEAINRLVLSADRVKIIDEVGDIRSRRYDRLWLDEIINYQHVLGCDDIGCIPPNEWVLECIYHLSNKRRSLNKTTIWTSNLNRQEFRNTFGAAIASRILGGVVLEVEGEDWRLK